MKFYLTSFLLLLFFFCGSNNSFAQEHLGNETAASPSALPEHVTPSNEHEDFVRKLHADHPYLPDAIIDRMEHESDTFQAKFFNMLFILALLIGFMILASWALKRLMKTKLSQRNIGSAIKVLETRYLSPRATLYLVEIHNCTVLIAESPTTVTCLSTLPQQPEQPSSVEV